MNQIKFYRQDDPYGEFSNFYKAEITINGKTFVTTEHYFQAMKHENTSFFETVRLAKTAGQAFKLARSKQYRTDWEKIKDDVMRTALKTKFTQHSKLKELLLSTGDKIIIEHTKNDNYWADGGDGTGKNMLGKLLMELRDQLKN